MELSNPDTAPYLWDYDISAAQFSQILAGKLRIGRLDQDWAAARLLEYGTYKEIVRLIGFPALVTNWSRWQKRVRSASRKRGLSFLVKWLPEKHPEYLR
jgi:hypothetical protein